MSKDIDKLSDDSRRWLQFFGLRTRTDVATALRMGFIAAGKRPGLTQAVCREIEKWTEGEDEENPHVSNVVALSTRA